MNQTNQDYLIANYCDPTNHTVVRGANPTVYAQLGFTAYQGPTDKDGLPTDSNWCRVQAGLAPIPAGSGPSGENIVYSNAPSVPAPSLPQTGSSIGIYSGVPILIGVVILAHALFRAKHHKD